MDIKIDSKAVQYIKAKGGVVHLAFSTQGGNCCGGGGGILIPDIFLGFPKGGTGNYQDIKVEDVQIFVSKDVYKESTQLKIGLDTLFVFKKLTVEGIESKIKSN